MTNKRSISSCLGLILVLSTASSLAAQSKWKVPEHLKALTSYVEVPVFPDSKDNPKLPRVLIMGDSISMYYTPEVRQLLSGKANVYRIPDNGKSTLYALKNIEYWLGDGHWAVIYFNFGLHDIAIVPTGTHQVPINTYDRNLRQLVKRLQATGAKLIWASTTPVPEGSRNRREEDVRAYNEVAKRIMEENHIPIDDLHAFVASRAGKAAGWDWQLPSNVHFRPKGCVELGTEVAKNIVVALSK